LDFKLKYLTALGEVARDRVDSGIERFSSIANNQAAPEIIRMPLNISSPV